MALTFQAIICDMDGLLLDTERLGIEAFVQAAQNRGLAEKLDIRAAFLKCVGYRLPESDEIITREFSAFTDVPELLRDWAEVLAPMMQGPIPTKPGAAELFAHVQALGLPIAVATSTRTDTAKAHLAQAGLLAFVTLVIGGDQVTHGKPDPETYLLAARRLGVDITRTAAFEDSDIGTLAAVRSGARTVQIPDLKDPCTKTRALGHIIAPTLLTGAQAVGLMD